MRVECPISIGELLDKLTILEIKVEKIKDAHKNQLVSEERDELWGKILSLGVDEASENFRKDLKAVNLELWEIEDKIRDKEYQKSFDKEFVELARSVYLTNDRRFEIKSQINEHFGSKIQEVKSYKKY